MNALLIKFMNFPLFGRKLVALTISVLLAALLFSVFWLPFSASQALSDKVDDLRLLLGKHQTIIAQHDTALPEQSKTELSDLFLQGQNEGLLQAELQGRMGELAKAHNIVFQSIGPAQSFELNGIQYIGVSIVFEGSMERIHNFLFAVESIKPGLLVRSANFNLNTAAINRAEPKRPNIDVQLALYGAVDLNSEDR